MVEYTAPNTSAAAIQELYDISNLLNTGLDRQTLIAAIQCIETGFNILPKPFYDSILIISYNINNMIL